MKPPPLAYHCPSTEDEALDLLRQHGDEARVLAGGQSLVALLNLRLARPERLVDITRVPSLSFIHAREQNLLLGAATRQTTIERSPLVSSRWPLIRIALAHVGHPQTRSRGTVGGSVAHADPAAELPVVFAALDARMHLRSAAANRTVGWDEFFQSAFVTSCHADEILAAVEVPPLASRTGVSFREYAVRYGDFAVAGAATVVTLDEGSRCVHAAIALLASGPRPVRAREAEQALIGQALTPELAADAASSALGAADFRSGHSELPGEYRGRVLRALVENTIIEATERAGQTASGSGP